MSTHSSKAKNLAPALSTRSKAPAVTSSANGRARGAKTLTQAARARTRAVHPPSSSPPRSSSPVLPQTSAKELREMTRKKTEEKKKAEERRLQVEVDQSDDDDDEARFNATFGSPRFEDNLVNEEEQMSVDGDIEDEDNMDVDGLMDTHGPDNEIHVESSPEPVTPTKKSTKQMGYGRGGLFTAYMACARKWVTSRFDLPGRLAPNEVKPVVTWLLHDGHYKYGDVDAENRTFDAGQPFGSEGLAHILRLEVFATKGNANVEVFKDIVAARWITGPTIALMFTAIEHALMEYSEGSYRFSEFSDAARPRYLFHLNSYEKIAAAAPTWANQFETSLFTLILMQSNKSHVLDVQADDMSNVDLAALEANAVSAKAREVSGASHATTAPIAGTSTAPIASASTAGLST
ncbi:hypothetical protein BT96DRAFT_949123 [Gymnopus androsaceus JB14]|uniref:DUF6532 domain-containing protein n=1 Tax=Gymnopus androsaceus JB14 TaxID=1447944 RepID=A0A6A4GMB3_9AGAR|nr:hypothetical protein BT96DRAFT_949123 [Gymnopus androsaceus JB14]